MTTQAIKTEVGSIPSPENWADTGGSLDLGDPSILFLEKALDGKVSKNDIESALDEYKRLHKAGISSPAELLTLSRAYPENKTYTTALSKLDIANDDKLVIGGPASIELVDREGHLITTDALGKAFDKYMANFRTRNAMVLHSDVQVGWALPAYISKSGQIFKSGVNGNGLFFITELRNDTKIAKKVAEQIHSGKLKSYSIAGSAIKTQNIQKGLQEVMQVDELELAEVTVCEKGVNQGASFEIIKSDNAATSSCIDGSCLVDEPKLPEVNLMLKSNGSIDFMKSFMGYMKKETLEGTSFATLHNTQARQDEHHHLLDKYGFPQEIDPEFARTTQVSYEIDPSGHNYVPWAVNEAGDNLAIRYPEEALTKPLIRPTNKRGVIEGGNSSETPVSELNTAEGFNNLLNTLTKQTPIKEEKRISKTADLFNWMAQEGNHIYKESCGCEFCFQKSANYMSVVEKPTNFLD
tara:strand:+ start:137 stop:1534 length:1398 start_codon:yes stop_codon:yes gene_type:complete